MGAGQFGAHRAGCTRYTALENLSQMAEHVRVIEHQIRELAAHAHEDHEVTWAEIGRALGVSRQAARQRFGGGAA